MISLIKEKLFGNFFYNWDGEQKNKNCICATTIHNSEDYTVENQFVNLSRVPYIYVLAAILFDTLKEF